MIKKYTCTIATSIFVLLLMIDTGPARAINFQPRLEMGFMQYEFESESFSETLPSVFYNTTLSALKFSDIMPFASVGVTVFTDRLFVDVGGLYAFR